MLVYVVAASLLLTTCNSFHLSITKNNHKLKNNPTFLNQPNQKTQEKSLSTLLKARSNNNEESKKKNIVVLSPPGGIGQISAIESVKLGASVCWFIVSNPSNSNDKVKLSSDVYNTYKDNIKIVGSTYENAASQSSVDSIVSSMNNKIDGLICTMDGIETKDLDEYNAWVDAVKSITSKISSYSKTKVAIASLDDKTFDRKSKFDIGNLFKGDNVDSLEEAIGINDDNTVVLYYGDLFGVPDSSDDSSPFQGGPRRDPIVRDEYTMRLIRLDALPVYNEEDDDDNSEEEVSKLLKLSPRTSRLSIGEASAAYLLSDTVDNTKRRQEFLLSSTKGLYPLSLLDWNMEFNKVITTSSPSLSIKQQLDFDNEILSIKFGTIPSIKRFFDWLETKWAPAILRSYDIAGIRVGERPVSTVRVGEDIISILFQTLDTKTYESTSVGKLIISLDRNNNDNPTIIVKREVTDSNFLESITSGKKKRKNKKNLFQGEDVLLRSLEDASNQAIEKKLATKITAVEEEPIVSLQSPQPVVVQSTSSTPQTGPKSKGARRSLERSRGSTTSRSSKSRRKKQKPSAANTIDDKDAFQ